MKNHFVDSTIIHAVESLFRDGERDPWASRLAGELVDLFVYSDVVRYPIPVRDATGGYDLAERPSLLRDLTLRDPKVFRG
jgi:hypothetical protein